MVEDDGMSGTSEHVDPSAKFPGDICGQRSEQSEVAALSRSIPGRVDPSFEHGR